MVIIPNPRFMAWFLGLVSSSLIICSYIVDWEEWSEATSKDTWRDLQYVVWNLARVSKGDYNDMSTWIL